MHIWYKSAIGLWLLFVLTGCSPTVINPTLEPTSASPALEEFSPTADEGLSVQPNATTETIEQPNRVIEETVEEEMSPTAESNRGNVGKNALIETAVSDLAERLGIAKDEIQVVSFEAVTWPDTSMGCPHPEMAYLQVLQDGSLIQLSAQGRVYEYHSGGNREPFLCEKTSSVKPTPLTLDDFAPPPGGDMDK